MKFKKMYADAKAPTKGSKYAAGWDLYAYIKGCDGIILPPGATAKIHSGIAVQAPNGYFGAIYARSGLATKHGLRPANAVGVVDAEVRP